MTIKQIISIELANKKVYSEIHQVWRNSVLATHDFLSKEDYEYYNELIPVYLDAVELYVAKNRVGEIIGFLGVSEHEIEMLFIDPSAMRLGVGRQFYNLR